MASQSSFLCAATTVRITKDNTLACYVDKCAGFDRFSSRTMANSLEWSLLSEAQVEAPDGPRTVALRRAGVRSKLAEFLGLRGVQDGKSDDEAAGSTARQRSC